MVEASSLLEGSWIITATNFPMWTSGKRQNPTITYSKLADNPLQFLDTVKYERKNKQKEIIGVDTFHSNHYIWRGKGLLKPLTSKWSILELTENILVIKFEQSLLTPAGIDILVRKNEKYDGSKQFVLASLKEQILSNVELESLIWL